MTRPSPDLDADSWTFALAIYGRPHVAEACLKLQDEAGVDVMLLLMTAFAAVRHGIWLSAAEIRDLDEVCRPWREQIVHPLRAMRVKLKSAPLLRANGETEPFRSKIKAVELAAEQLQNKLMADHLPIRPPERTPIAADDLCFLLRRFVALALEARGGPQISELYAPIDDIVAAATSTELNGPV